MNEEQRQESEKEMAPYVAIIKREFCKARGLPANYPLDVYFRTDESIVIVDAGLPPNIWIMQIGSDDDDFDFVDNDGVECQFPIPEDWFELQEGPPR
jgi:hypothetical protein